MSAAALRGSGLAPMVGNWPPAELAGLAYLFRKRSIVREIFSAEFMRASISDHSSFVGSATASAISHDWEQRRVSGQVVVEACGFYCALLHRSLEDPDGGQAVLSEAIRVIREWTHKDTLDSHKQSALELLDRFLDVPTDRVVRAARGFGVQLPLVCQHAGRGF